MQFTGVPARDCILVVLDRKLEVSLVGWSRSLAECIFDILEDDEVNGPVIYLSYVFAWNSTEVDDHGSSKVSVAFHEVADHFASLTFDQLLRKLIQFVSFLPVTSTHSLQLFLHLFSVNFLPKLHFEHVITARLQDGG